jgi:hypothetical protein
MGMAIGASEEIHELIASVDERLSRIEQRLDGR